MKALQRFISIFLFLATLSCNFDGSLDRQVCNGCTNGVQSLATIFFLNQEDGSDRYCVGGQMDWAMRTFDLTPWGGSATQMFANGSALASSISSLTGQQWSYVPATCSLESRTPGAVDAMGELSRHS